MCIRRGDVPPRKSGWGRGRVREREEWFGLVGAVGGHVELGRECCEKIF